MDSIVPFVWSLIPSWLADRLEELFHAPFWLVMAGATVAALSAVAYSALPAAARDKVKLFAVLGALAIAALELVPRLERSFPLG